MVQINMECIRHKAHPYRERQKEHKRKVRVHGEHNLKLKRRILAFFKKSCHLRMMSSLSERLYLR